MAGMLSFLACVILPAETGPLAAEEVTVIRTGQQQGRDVANAQRFAWKEQRVPYDGRPWLLPLLLFIFVGLYAAYVFFCVPDAYVAIGSCFRFLFELVVVGMVLAVGVTLFFPALHELSDTRLDAVEVTMWLLAAVLVFLAERRRFRKGKPEAKEDGGAAADPSLINGEKDSGSSRNDGRSEDRKA